MDLMKVLKLDILSVKPYFTIKNLIILFGMGIGYGALSKNPVTALATAQMFAILFSGYPFMVGEESGIDPLYKLFGISPKDVVKGRYLLASLFVGAMILIGIVLAFIISLIFQINNGALTILVTAPIIGLVTLFIIFIEYPIYFKYGYKKGKTLVIIPFLLLAVIVLATTFFANQLKVVTRFLLMNEIFSVSILLVIIVTGMILSLKLSNKFYSESDF